jgi:hypothetical protein
MMPRSVAGSRARGLMNCVAENNPIYQKCAASGMREILSGKRTRNTRQIAAHAQRFWILK